MRRYVLSGGASLHAGGRLSLQRYTTCHRLFTSSNVPSRRWLGSAGDLTFSGHFRPGRITHRTAPFHHSTSNKIAEPGTAAPPYTASPSNCTTILDFKHTPLEDPVRQIRLIDIHDGHFEDDMRISLRVVDLDTKEQYTALSYAWGEPIFNRSIVCNNKEKPVTENLLTALRWLRHYKVKTCWIDAICIDQSDEAIVERSKQVPEMGKIFGTAQRVIAYLGDGDDNVRAALDLAAGLAAFGKEFGVLDNTTGRTTGKSSVDEHSYGVRFPVNGDLQWDHYEDIFCRPWFSRLWVLQEVVLARHVDYLCAGSLGSFWDLLFSRKLRMQKPNSLSSVSAKWMAENISTFFYILDRCRLFEEASSVAPYVDSKVTEETPAAADPMFNILKYSRFFHCSDPRDKLYGVLGLGKDSRLQPDYSATCRDVYKNFALRMIERSQYDARRVIRSAGRQFQTSEVPDLPSWVPDWTYYTLMSNLQSPGESEIKHDEPFIELNTEDANLISLHGTIVDSIAKIGTITPSVEHMWHELWTRGGDFDAWMDRHKSILKAIADYPEDQVPGILAHIMSNGRIPRDEIRSAQDLRNTHWANIVFMSADKALALTSKNNVAVVGSKARVGDVIFHMPGEPWWQYLLRPTLRSDNAWELIGETRWWLDDRVRDFYSQQWTPQTVLIA